jgi:hypothetical protein
MVVVEGNGRVIHAGRKFSINIETFIYSTPLLAYARLNYPSTGNWATALFTAG